MVQLIIDSDINLALMSPAAALGRSAADARLGSRLRFPPLVLLLLLLLLLNINRSARTSKYESFTAARYIISLMELLTTPFKQNSQSDRQQLFIIILRIIRHHLIKLVILYPPYILCNV